MRPRVIARIARWEVTTGASGFDRRTVMLTVGLMLIVAGLLPLTFAVGGSPESDIYRVGVSESNRFHDAVAADPKFVVRPPDEALVQQGELEVLIEGNLITIRDTGKGRAAGAALESALEAYNTQLMAQEPDHDAAFPVSVQLRYVEQQSNLVSAATTEPDTTQDTTATTPAGDQSTSGVDTSGNEEQTQGTAAPGGGDRMIPSVGSSTALLGQMSGSPTEISPPFPFVSLVLAFAFVVPMNFVIQAYSSSILHECQNRRGELLLVAPIGPVEIVAGKTFPYFLVMLGIATVTAVAIGGGVSSVLAVAPIAMLFLACAFVGAVLARSQKELTFVLVTVSVVVTTYVFVPAIFTQTHPIAAISPLTLVVRDLEGAGFSLSTFLFSTGPVYVAALVLFGFGLGMFREEDLFSQRNLPPRILDALAAHITRHWHAAIVSILSLPFVFVAELLAISILFVVPISMGIPVLLVIIAIIEEAAKSIHILAGFERGRYDRSLRTAVVVGMWSGFGFFIGEKGVLLAQLVGLPDLELGWVAFEVTAGIGGSSGLLLVGLIAAPLVLHMGTAVIASLGAQSEPRHYVVGFLIAVGVHAAYNFVVVSSFV